MDRPEKIVVLRDDLELHPAFLAWKRVHPRTRRPTSIEILKPERRKSTVYRLHGIGASGKPVVTKRRHEGYLEMEHRLYAEVFPELALRTLGVYGFIESYDDYSWLFLEDAGETYYSPNVREHQLLAVDWLAALHTTATFPIPWLRRTGSAYQFDVLKSAQREVRQSLGHRALTPSNIETLDSILRSLHTAEERWIELDTASADAPESLVHGDFVPKNVRIWDQGGGRLELVAFDWETSGWATPATDLALLPRERAPLRAYHTRVREAGWSLGWPGLVRLQALGDLFRLINCVHWEARSFQHDWIEGAVTRMELYELWLKAALEQDLVPVGTT
jgi:hypothetical protein